MDNIVSAINDAVAAFLEKDNIQANVHGIAEAAIIDDVGGEEQMRPAIISEDGEIDSDMFDDRYPVCFYHRLNGKTYSGNTNSGYGDNIGYTEEADMSMIVFGMRRAISAHALEEYITNIIQRVTHKKGGARGYCMVKSVSFDRRQVFSGEYSGVRFFIQPNIFLFKVNYKIITARNTCH